MGTDVLQIQWPLHAKFILLDEYVTPSPDINKVYSLLHCLIIYWMSKAIYWLMSFCQEKFCAVSWIMPVGCIYKITIFYWKVSDHVESALASP